MAVVGILCVFFHPAALGPFAATQGPATAFRALVAASLVFAAIRSAFGISAGAISLCLHVSSPTPAMDGGATALYALRC